MTAILTGKITDTVNNILCVNSSNAGLSASFQSIASANGTAAAFQVSTAGVKLTGTMNYGAYTVAFGGNFSASSSVSFTGAVSTAGAFTLSGAYGFTGTLTNTTSVTFPTTGTLSTLAGSEVFTNKTLTAPAISAPVLSGSVTGTYTLAGTPTITSPTINTPTVTSPAISGTVAYTTPTITGTLTGGTYSTITLNGTITSSSVNWSGTFNGGTWTGMTVTSPTLITPLLGTPTSGVLTNCTGYTNANLPAKNYQLSSSCGNFSGGAGAGPTAITNLSATITSTGRPIFVGLVPDGTTNANAASTSNTGNIYLFRDSTQISNLSIIGNVYYAPSSVQTIDPSAAGTYTYTAKYSNASSNLLIPYMKLIAYEL